MTRGVIMQLKDVVYMSEQALRWTPESDSKGRFISGVTLYWERDGRPVIKTNVLNLDDPNYNLETVLLEQVLEYGKPTGITVFRGIESPFSGEPIMLAGVIEGDTATFFGIRFGGSTLSFREILGEEVVSRPETAGTFVIEHLSSLIESAMRLSNF